MIKITDSGSVDYTKKPPLVKQIFVIEYTNHYERQRIEKCLQVLHDIEDRSGSPEINEQQDPYSVMIEKIAPRLLQNLREKSEDYGDVFFDLGLKGQYSDMHRKMRKLRTAMWDSEALTGEQPEEILSDLFGNILISLYLYFEQRSD